MGLHPKPLLKLLTILCGFVTFLLPFYVLIYFLQRKHIKFTSTLQQLTFPHAALTICTYQTHASTFCQQTTMQLVFLQNINKWNLFSFTALSWWRTWTEWERAGWTRWPWPDSAGPPLKNNWATGESTNVARRFWAGCWGKVTLCCPLLDPLCSPRISSQAARTMTRLVEDVQSAALSDKQQLNSERGGTVQLCRLWCLN